MANRNEFIEALGVQGPDLDRALERARAMNSANVLMPLVDARTLPECPHCDLRVKGDMDQHVAQYCPVARYRRGE